MVWNIHVHSRLGRLLTIDEVEQVQRQRIASLIGHIFQLTYANMVDELIQEEKLNRYHGCVIQHPSQRQHWCLMMDKEDSWLYYREDVVKKNWPECRPSSETQGKSVGPGEKARQKFSSTGGKAPGYRLSPDHFQTVKRILAPDWAQKVLCIIVPNRRTASPEFYSWVRTRRLLSRHS